MTFALAFKWYLVISFIGSAAYHIATNDTRKPRTNGQLAAMAVEMALLALGVAVLL